MKSYEQYIKSNLSDSRFATVNEMKNGCEVFNCKDFSCKAGGIPVVSNGTTAYVDGKDTNTIVFGATGSMKTRRLVLPTILSLLAARESVIVSDPKSEIYDMTVEKAKKLKYKIVKIDLRDPKHSDCWNPMVLPYQFYKEGNIDMACGLLNDFITQISADQRKSKADPFWIETASSLALGASLILMGSAQKEECNISSLYSIAVDHTDELVALSRKLNPNSIAAMNLNGVFCSAPKTQASIVVTLFSMLSRFILAPSLSAMLSQNTFDIDKIGKEPTIVYIIMPDEKSTMQFLVSTFIKQVYERLICIAQECSNHTLPVRVNFILDEFGNMPKIEDCTNMLSAARSRNIRFVLIAQSKRQLKSLYEENAETIISNCENIYFLAGRESELLNELSGICGTYEDDNGIRQPIIPPDRLMRLSKEKGEVLVIAGRKPAFISRLPDISQYPFEAKTPENEFRFVKSSVPIFNLLVFERNLMIGKDKTA